MVRQIKIALTFFLLVLALPLLSAEAGYYWIQFNTKEGTPYTIDRPIEFVSSKSIERRMRQNIAFDETDLPVNPLFVKQLKDSGLVVVHTSRWMNAAIAVVADTIDLNSISALQFVSSVELRKPTDLKSAHTTNKFDLENVQAYYANSYRQVSMLRGDTVHNLTRGAGISIGVIDSGFLNADIHSAFDSLFARGGVLGTCDVVNPGGNVYLEHYHGAAVLSTMAALEPGAMIGTAPDANYWLIRSEDASSEFPIEEDYWIVATEFADSVGCDVINTSLGYTTFDEDRFNHTYNEFNGETLRISKVANLAVDKGMVVVCSAGNEANNSWHFVVSPSEATKVLSVAAVDEMENISSFSSWGFGDTNKPFKPDVAAMGTRVSIMNSVGGYRESDGTSFSSPLLAGMAACLVRELPQLNAAEVIDIIRKSGDRYPAHDARFGYGIPDFWKSLQAWKVNSRETDSAAINLYPNPFTEGFTIVGQQKIESVRIFETQGKLISTLTADKSDLNRWIFPVNNNLSKGIYLVEVRSKYSVKTFKVIKE